MDQSFQGAYHTRHSDGVHGSLRAVEGEEASTAKGIPRESKRWHGSKASWDRTCFGRHETESIVSTKMNRTAFAVLTAPGIDDLASTCTNWSPFANLNKAKRKPEYEPQQSFSGLFP